MAWWYAREKGSEYWGSARTKGEAIFKGKQEFGKDPFWIAHGERMANRLELFDKDDFTDDPEAVIFYHFNRHNEEHFGEDGEGGPAHWNHAHVEELTDLLNETFAGWARKHGYDKGWAVDFDNSSYEQVEPHPVMPELRGK